MRVNKAANAGVKAVRLSGAVLSLAWSSFLVYAYLKDVEKKTKRIGQIITA